MKKGCFVQLRHLLMLLCVGFVCASVSAFAVPSAPQTATLVRFKVHSIEFQNSEGVWVPFTRKHSVFNFFQSESPIIRQIQATMDVPAGNYVAARIVFDRTYGIEWSMYDNNNLIFYFTNTHNNGINLSSPGMICQHPVSVLTALACTDTALVSAEAIPIPFGSVYDGLLEASGFMQFARNKKTGKITRRFRPCMPRKYDYLLSLEQPLSFQIDATGPLPVLQIDFTGATTATNEVIYDEVIVEDGSTRPVIYPVVPSITMSIVPVTNLCPV